MIGVRAARDHHRGMDSDSMIGLASSMSGIKSAAVQVTGVRARPPLERRAAPILVYATVRALWFRRASSTISRKLARLGDELQS